MGTTGKVRRWVFGAGTAAALGFGGAQALAAPAPAAEKVCDDRLCYRLCVAANNNGGACTAQGFCVCYRG